MAIATPIDHRPVFLSSLGLPLVYGRLYAFAQGTDNPKALYTDESLTTQATHPVLLGDDGRPTNQLFCESGQYTIRTYIFNGGDPLTAPDEDWSLDNEWDQDGLESVVAPSVESVGVVETIADLRNVDPGDYVTIDVLGYYTSSDCFTRRYRWNAVSVLSDNYGAVIESNVTGTGRWILQQEGSSIDVRSFGLIPGSTSTYNSQLTALEAWANAAGVRSVYFPAGNYRFSGITQTMRVVPVVETGVTFYNTNASTPFIMVCKPGWDIRIVAGIQHSSSVGKCVFQFPGTGDGYVAGEVRAVWYGHVNETDDHSSIANDLRLYVGYTNTLVVDRKMNVATLSSDWYFRLRTIAQGLLYVSHDPSGNSYRLHPYSVRNDSDLGYSFTLTYPNALGIDALFSQKLRTSWFNNASSLTNWAAMLDTNGIAHSGINYPSVIVDSNIDMDSSMSTNVWSMEIQGGLIDITASGVIINRINAGNVPVFETFNYYPLMGCAVNANWWKLAGATTNQTITLAISAAGEGGGKVVDFAGCGLMSGYTTELLFLGNTIVRNLEVTGTGDFRPSEFVVDFIDCNMTSTSGDLINFTNDSVASERVHIERCSLTASSGDAISITPEILYLKDCKISGTGAINIDSIANTKIRASGCEITGYLSISAIDSEFVECDFIGLTALTTAVSVKGPAKFIGCEFYQPLNIGSTSAYVEPCVVSGCRFIHSSDTYPSIITIKANEATTQIKGLHITGCAWVGTPASRTVAIVTSKAIGASWKCKWHHVRIGNNTSENKLMVVPVTFGSVPARLYKRNTTYTHVYISGSSHDTFANEFRDRIFCVPYDTWENLGSIGSIVLYPSALSGYTGPIDTNYRTDVYLETTPGYYQGYQVQNNGVITAQSVDTAIDGYVHVDIYQNDNDDFA